MGQERKTLENPMHKERITFLDTAAETGGELLRARVVIGPGGGVPMPHVHPHQEERWAIEAGRGRFRLGRQERLAGPGETVVAAPGTPHALSNAGSEDLSMIVELRPALRTEQLFETVCDLAARGELDAKGRPRPLQALAIGRAFREETALPWIPRVVQRVLLALAAPFVRLPDNDKRPARSTNP